MRNVFLGKSGGAANYPSTYSYDESSGFYFDSATGLYYDPKTQVGRVLCVMGTVL